MSLILDDFSSSTPIKREQQPFEQSVEDLLQVIDNNISSASLNEHNGSSSFSSQENIEDHISPIKPLNLKQQVQQQGQSINSLLSEKAEEITNNNSTDLLEKVMEDIPRAPSFDELDFNTRVNRTSSLSRLSGPRQMSNSALRRTFSNRSSPNKSPNKSQQLSTLDDSPSKKSVCFENSPPKILEYDELTPENSDDSELNDTFESKWQANNLSSHPLPPPPPPKHIISTPSPQKETSLGSNEDSQDFELTTDDIKSQAVSLEQKLDLVLNNNSISERVQYDESFNGSGSPSKPKLTKEEQDILYSIKNRDQIEKDEALSLANSMFEEDIRNTNKDSKRLELDPALKRRGSSSSLRDEERELGTRVISSSEKAVSLEDGLKNSDPVSFQSADVSQSTLDSFRSATEIMEDSSMEIMETRDALATKDSTNSIATLRGDLKKSNSISDSIHNGLNLIGSFISGSPSKRQTEEEEDDDDHLSSELAEEEIDLNTSAVNEDVAVVENPQTYEDAPISTITAAQTVENLVESETTEEESNKSEDLSQQLAPPISLPEFESSLNESSLLSELKGSEAFSSVLDVTGTESKFDVNEKIEIGSDNEEVVEGYRSLSPKKHITPTLTRSVSPSPGALSFSETDSQDEVIIANKPAYVTEEEDEVKEESQPETNILALPEVEQIESEQSSFEVKQIKLEEADRNIQIPQETILLPAINLKESTEGQDDINVPESSVSIADDHLPLDEELNSQTVKVESIAEDEYQSLNPSVRSSPVKQTLPTFNSLLFHDKEPLDDSTNDLKKPLDYISIWHSQPVATSPDLQYSVRKKKKPKKVMKLLEKGLKEESDSEDELNFERSIQEIFVKKEQKVQIPKDSFITRSVSKSSFISLNTSRRSSFVLPNRVETSKRSSWIKQEFPEPRVTSTYYDTVETTNNDISVNLPDVDSSDFGTAFAGWDVSATETNEDTPVIPNNPTTLNNDNIKSIWGSNSTSPVTATFVDLNHTKIQSIIGNGTDTQVKSQKFSSNLGALIGNSETFGVDIEFDQDSQFDIFNDRDQEDGAVKQVKSQTDTPKASSPAIFVPVLPQKTQREKLEQPQNFRLVSSVEKSPIKSDLPINIKHIDQAKLRQNRLISGASQGSGFDLNYDFDRVIQLQERSYAVHENNDIIRASSDLKKEFTEDVLDHTELNRSYVPDASDLPFQRTHDHGSYKQRVTTPLSNVNESKLNSISIPKHQEKTQSILQNRIVSAANSENDGVVGGADLNVKKRNVSEIRPVKSQQSLAHDLPVNDHGRLYIHLNRLRGIKLDEIKHHKATFKLYLDNGKHKISTPKFDLSNSVNIDKEFEMAVEENLTDLYLTLKINYYKPENELVEIVERIPITNPNRFSRLLGVKPKYKQEKKFISRKREVDSWDNMFARDGSFGKNKISFKVEENDITGQTRDYSIELFNEWTSQIQSGKSYKVDPYLIGKLDVTMLYIPRSSPLESLPPSIKIAKTVMEHLTEQKNMKFEGFLYQEGGDCELWKRRFFKIVGTNLIAHHETSKKPRAQINLLKVVDVIHSGKKKQPNQRNITAELLMSDTFKLVFRNGEIINFNAETKESKINWIKILEKVVSYNKFHQPWSRLLSEKATAVKSTN